MIKFLQYSQGELIIRTSGQQMYEITKDINAWLNKEQINNTIRFGIGKFNNLKFLGIQDKVHLVSMNTSDYMSVIRVINEILPDEIYNLSGQSSVGLSFDQPKETIESIIL